MLQSIIEGALCGLAVVAVAIVAFVVVWEVIEAFAQDRDTKDGDK